MNNTTTRTLTAITAVIIAATLVVGAGTLGATTTQSALAYAKKDNKKDGGNGNDNTVIAQINKEDGTQSGFDNIQEQETQNLICTNPGNNATCLQEGAVQTVTPKPIAKTCVECFTTLLSSGQISKIKEITAGLSLEEICTLLKGGGISVADLQAVLDNAQVSTAVQKQLISCLINAGMQFT